MEFLYQWRKNLKAIRHFDRLHWGWSIEIDNCNSHPVQLVAVQCAPVCSRAQDHQLQNKNKTVTSLLLCVWLRTGKYPLVKWKMWSVYAAASLDLLCHIKECQNGNSYLLLEFPNEMDRIWNLGLFHIKSNKAHSLNLKLWFIGWEAHYIYGSFINWKYNWLGFKNRYWFAKIRIY